MIHRTVIYSVECDECDAISDDYQYGKLEAEEFKGRGVRFVRTMASRDGWTTFSERDLCPAHSGKRVRLDHG